MGHPATSPAGFNLQMYQNHDNQDVVDSGASGEAPEALREIDLRLRSTTDPKERTHLLLNRAVLLGMLGQFDAAASQLELALREVPTDKEIRLQCEYIGAGILHQEHQYEEAYNRMTAILSDYSSILEIPEFRFIFRDIQAYRAFELVQLARFDEALPLLHESLSYGMKADDENTAVVNLGICYSKLRSYDKAIEYLRRSLKTKLTPDWEGQARCQLAIAYTHVRLFAEAKEQLELCVQHVDEYELPRAVVYGWLSRVQRGLGNQLEAERYSRLARPS